METEENCSNSDNLELSGKESIRNLSSEQIEELAAAKVQGVRDIIGKAYPVENYNKAAENGHFPVTTRNLTDLLRKSHYVLDGVPLDRVTSFLKTIANMLIQTKAIGLICEIYKYYIEAGWTFEEDGVQKVDKTKWTTFSNSALILVNYSDTSDELALYIAQYPGLLDAIRYGMVERKEAHLKGKQTEKDAEISEKNLTLSHNIAMRDANVTVLRHHDLTTAVQPYLDSPLQKIRLIALATLASIVDEKESEIINAKKGSVEVFLLYLEKGLKNPLRRYWGWSCTEIAYIVRMLARNDANKKMLCGMGAVEILVKVGRTGNEEEISQVIHALWALAFDPDIRKMMVEKEEIGLVELLQNIQDSSDKLGTKRACDGALWTIREELKSSTNEKYKQLGKRQERDSTIQDPKFKMGKTAIDRLESQEEARPQHIMISYHWKDQKIIVKVKDMLQASGFKVWMDIDQMSGSIIQAMADGVENADIFLMAMSHRYKDSPNCRAEAEYAFTKHKKIIPLKMERDYNADGWLGFILGAKLYFEFSGKVPFENKMEELLKEIRMFKVQGQNVKDQVIPTNVQQVTRQPADTVDSPPVFHRVISKIRGWEQSDVQDWIDKYDLNRCWLFNITPGEVELLITMRQEAPEYFYECLQSMFKVKDLWTMSKIVLALTNLVE